MGRPRKQTVDYFPHFVGTDSKTKFILEESWGNNGYAFWFKLLELLGRSEGHYYDCSSIANRKYLTAFMKIDEQTISDILETLADLGKIDPELWRERKVIWCQRLVDNLQDVYSKRTVSAPSKPFTEAPQPQPPKDTPKQEKAPAEEKPPEEKKKRGRPKKPEVEKTKYAEFVKMTEEEYQKLVTAHGEEKTKRAIEILDNYKGSKGKTYKNDYRAILSWVIDRVNEEFGKRGGSGYVGAYKDRGHTAAQQPTDPGGFKPSGGFKK